MAENNKLTKKEQMEAVIKALKTIEGSESLVEFMQDELQMLIEKYEKQSASRKKKGVNNDKIIENIIREMEALEEGKSISDLLEIEALQTYVDDKGETKKMSNQKLNSLMTKLKDDGVVTREVKKGQARFILTSKVPVAAE